MKIIKEFKEFAMKGNVLDLAIGVIIGGAFGKIVSSLVADIIMPFISTLLAGVKFSDLKWVLKAATDNSDAITLNYGQFLQNTFDFIIIAFSIFMFIKVINRMKKKEEAKAEEPAQPSEEVVLLQQIRDLLKSR
jgi:large conductance mechanosensitive channel